MRRKPAVAPGLRAVSGFQAITGAHAHQLGLWPDIGQHRVVALLAYAETNLVERARSAGDQAAVELAVMELGGTARLALDRLLGQCMPQDMSARLQALDWEETGLWRGADDPLFAWQTEVLLALSGVFLAAASEPMVREQISERSLLRVISACVDYADWAQLVWRRSRYEQRPAVAGRWHCQEGARGALTDISCKHS